MEKNCAIYPCICMLYVYYTISKISKIFKISKFSKNFKTCWQTYFKSIGTLSQIFKNHIVTVDFKWCVPSAFVVFLSKNDKSGGFRSGGIWFLFHGIWFLSCVITSWSDFYPLSNQINLFMVIISKLITKNIYYYIIKGLLHEYWWILSRALYHIALMNIGEHCPSQYIILHSQYDIMLRTIFTNIHVITLYYY
jgi:hypothetical protein